MALQEVVYANVVDICVYIEKSLSIFWAFNRLSRSNWRTQKATCLEKGNGIEPTEGKHHISYLCEQRKIIGNKFLKNSPQKIILDVGFYEGLVHSYLHNMIIKVILQCNDHDILINGTSLWRYNKQTL